MFFQALILIAACLCEQIFVPVEANAEDESIVYVKQGAEEECLATIAKACPTIESALEKIVDPKPKYVIKILKGTADLVWRPLETAKSETTYLIQGAKNATEDEIVTLEFPTTLTGYGLTYKSKTELKDLKFLCPAGFDNENIYLITCDQAPVGITLNTVTFERKPAESVANANLSPCYLMNLGGEVSMNNVVITSPEPWIVKSGVDIGPDKSCTLTKLQVKNVSTPDSENPVVGIMTTKDLTIVDSSFTNCKADKSAHAGALGIRSSDKDAKVTFKNTSFTGCTAEGGLAGALAVSHAGTEAKIEVDGGDALAFTDCSIGTGEKKVATAAVFEFLDDTANLETFADKIKNSFGKDYNNVAHKNLILGKVGEKGEKVDLSKYFPEPKVEPKEDAAFGVKVNFALFLVALLSVFAALL